MAKETRMLDTYGYYSSDEIVQDFVSGLSFKELSAKYQKSEKAIDSYLRRRRINSSKCKLSHEELLSLISSGQTFDEIATSLGICKSHLGKRFRAAGINIKEHYQKARASGKSGRIFDIDEIVKMYCVERKSSIEIAQHFGFAGDGVIRDALKKAGVKIRVDGMHQLKNQDTPWEVWEKVRNKDWLFDQYISQQKSTIEIANEIGSSDVLIQRHLEHFGIKRRNALFYTNRRVKGSKHDAVIKYLEDNSIKHQSCWILEGKHNKRMRRFEIDEYLPEHNMLLEINGEYFHGLTPRSRKYAGVRRKMWSDLIKYLVASKLHPDLNFVMISEKEVDDGTWTRVLGQTKPNKNPLVKGESYIDYIDYPTAKNFVVLNHYSRKCPPAKRYYGMTYGGHLVAVASIASPTRNNILLSNKKKPLELTRLCANKDCPKNGLTYFLSKILKSEKNFCSGIVTFADPSPGVGHFGTVYRAANFSFVGNTAWNYHYISDDGLEYHKKKIYNLAKKKGMIESEFAKEFGFHKIPEFPKLKFEYLF